MHRMVTTSSLSKLILSYMAIYHLRVLTRSANLLRTEKTDLLVAMIVRYPMRTPTLLHTGPKEKRPTKGEDCLSKSNGANTATMKVMTMEELAREDLEAVFEAEAGVVADREVKGLEGGGG
jgi:hypothetical protein